VDVTVVAGDGGWPCDAILSSAAPEADREFLMELDPVFTLSFEDGSAVLVDVTAESADGAVDSALRLSLTASAIQQA